MGVGGMGRTAIHDGEARTTPALAGRMETKEKGRSARSPYSGWSGERKNRQRSVPDFAFHRVALPSEPTVATRPEETQSATMGSTWATSFPTGEMAPSFPSTSACMVPPSARTTTPSSTSTAQGESGSSIHQDGPRTRVRPFSPTSRTWRTRVWVLTALVPLTRLDPRTDHFSVPTPVTATHRVVDATSVPSLFVPSRLGVGFDRHPFGRSGVRSSVGFEDLGAGAGAGAGVGAGAGAGAGGVGVGVGV